MLVNGHTAWQKSYSRNGGAAARRPSSDAAEKRLRLALEQDSWGYHAARSALLLRQPRSSRASARHIHGRGAVELAWRWGGGGPFRSL
jgi:hypothetical protein